MASGDHFTAQHMALDRLRFTDVRDSVFQRLLSIELPVADRGYSDLTAPASR